MENYDDSRYKLELLRMARELMNEEYINKRAEDHNKWVAESELAWKTRGVKLPYPPFAPYPTESDIVAKALNLYNFVSTDKNPPVDKPNSPFPQVSSQLSEREQSVASKLTVPPKLDLPVDSPWTTYLNAKPDVPTNTVVASSSITMSNSAVESEIAAPENIDTKPLFAKTTILPAAGASNKNLPPSWVNKEQ